MTLYPNNPIKRFWYTSKTAYYFKAVYLLTVIALIGAWSESNTPRSKIIASVAKAEFRLNWLRDMIIYKCQA